MRGQPQPELPVLVPVKTTGNTGENLLAVHVVMSEGLQVKPPGKPRTVIAGKQGWIGDDLADRRGAGLAGNADSLGYRLFPLLAGECPANLDDLDDPVDIGPGRIVDPLAQLPRREMGQFQVAVGVDQTGDDRAPGELDDRGVEYCGELIQPAHRQYPAAFDHQSATFQWRRGNGNEMGCCEQFKSHGRTQYTTLFPATRQPFSGSPDRPFPSWSG